MSDAWRESGPFVAFPFPVPIPTPGSKDAPLVSLCVNEDWASYIRGAMKLLARRETWQGTDSEVDAAILEAQNILDAWEDSCVSQIQFDQTDDCTLKVSLDGGATWSQIFDAARCVHSLVPNTKAPALIGPPPSLTCTNYDVECPANAAAELPVLLNAGDTVRIVSHTNDVWTDDLIGSFTDTDHFYCADGTHVDLVPGFCGAGESSHSGDPMSTANHMELLLVVNGTYYRVLAGTVTIPSGVSNARGYLVPNDSILYDNFFAQSVVVEICTNRWYHTFDFSLGAQLGWTNARQMPWDGSGFLFDGGGPDCNVDSPAMSTGVVTFFEHFYDPPLRNDSGSQHCAYQRDTPGCFDTATLGGGSDFLEDVGANTTHFANVSAYTHLNVPGTESPRHKLVKVILGGTGTEPTWP